MIVETSALVAIVLGEPERASFTELIRADKHARMSAASYLEASIALDRTGDPLLSREVDEILAMLDVEVVPFTAMQSQIARQAYRDFGKGSGHPAQLNFGDCFAYALASQTGEPLLYQGDDFAHTGVRSAL